MKANIKTIMHIPQYAALACALLILMPASARAAGQPLRLKHTGTVSGFSGGLFRNTQGFWLDQRKESFYVLDTSPSVVNVFDRQGRALKYFSIDESLKGPVFLGAAYGVLYVKSGTGTVAMDGNFSKAASAAFFFVPPAQPDAATSTERYPLDFSLILPGGDGRVVGLDQKKKNIYSCDSNGDCRVFIRTVMKYGNDVMTGQIQTVYRDYWGRYFLVDREARQVWKFDTNGRFLSKALNPIDMTRDRLYQPELVAVDRFKRCFIYDAAIRKIKVYDDMGIFLAEIDAQDAANDVLLILPAAMEIDDFGRLYIWDKGDLTIKIYQINEAGF